MRIEVLDDGAFRFINPNGESFDSVAAGHTQPFGNWTQLPVVHHQRGIRIDKNTAVTRWRGERMDSRLKCYFTRLGEREKFQRERRTAEALAF